MSKSVSIIDAETVRAAYRLLLDREPESEQVIKEHLKLSTTVSQLRARILASAEFRRKNANLRKASLAGNEPALSIEIEPSADSLVELFTHIETVWRRLGEEEPHWSVSSSEIFKKSNISQTEENFYFRGRSIVENYLQALARNGIDHRELRTALDFGCGLARNAIWLSKHFECVHAYDISVSHIAYAQRRITERQISNIEFHHLRVDSFKNLKSVDAVFSVIVLQHNPPPLIHVAINALLGCLNPGGVAYFQVPTYRKGYSFSVNKYLVEQVGRLEMEMHVLPQRAIFELAEKHGCRTLEVLEDTWAGTRDGELSNTFIIQKRHE